jgi:hypothetical protein
MKVGTRLGFLFIVGASVALSPTIAAEPPKAQKTANDPNEKICEKITPLGSRLVTKRVCATRAEWAERRLQARQDIDKAQQQFGRKDE